MADPAAYRTFRQAYPETEPELHPGRNLRTLQVQFATEDVDVVGVVVVEPDTVGAEVAEAVAAGSDAPLRTA